MTQAESNLSTDPQSIHPEVLDKHFENLDPLPVSQEIIEKMLISLSEDNRTSKRKTDNALTRCCKIVLPFVPCPACRHCTLRSDGTAKNTWRIYCSNCEKTSPGSDIPRRLPLEVARAYLDTIEPPKRVEAAEKVKFFKAPPQKEATKQAKRIRFESLSDDLTGECSYGDGLSPVAASLEPPGSLNTDDLTAFSKEDLVTLVQSLRSDNLRMQKRIVSLESENRKLADTLDKTAGMDPKEPEIMPLPPQPKTSYAAAASAYRPAVKKPVAKPKLEDLFKNKEQSTATSPIIAGKPKSSDMKLVFFSGCIRSNISLYRRSLQQKGFERHLARDLCFLTDSILQVLTYSNAEADLVAAMVSINPAVKHVPSFNPTDPFSYGSIALGMSAAEVTNNYFRVILDCSTRLRKLAEVNPSMTRAANFMDCVHSNQDYKLQSKTKQEKVLFLVSMIPKPTSIH